MQHLCVFWSCTHCHEQRSPFLPAIVKDLRKMTHASNELSSSPAPNAGLDNLIKAAIMIAEKDCEYWPLLFAVFYVFEIFQ